MTEQCYSCTHRISDCSLIDQKKQQVSPDKCRNYQNDANSPWERGWLGFIKVPRVVVFNGFGNKEWRYMNDKSEKNCKEALLRSSNLQEQSYPAIHEPDMREMRDGL